MTGLWLALAFSPSVMLGAVSVHHAREVAAVPFLWMLPLALYLASFILCSTGRMPVAPRGASRWPWPRAWRSSACTASS